MLVDIVDCRSFDPHSVLQQDELECNAVHQRMSRRAHNFPQQHGVQINIKSCGWFRFMAHIIFVQAATSVAVPVNTCSTHRAGMTENVPIVLQRISIVWNNIILLSTVWKAHDESEQKLEDCPSVMAKA